MKSITDKIKEIVGVTGVEKCVNVNKLLVSFDSLENIIKNKATKMGFLIYRHEWNGIEPRPACKGFVWVENWNSQGYPALKDSGSSVAIWTGKQGWAKIIKEEIIVTTEDGCPIHPKESCWAVNIKDLVPFMTEGESIKDMANCKYFSLKSYAEEWIKDHKPVDMSLWEMMCDGSLKDALRPKAASIEEMKQPYPKSLLELLHPEEKAKSLKTEELVDGNIYVDTKGLCPNRIIRFKQVRSDYGIDLYSQLMTHLDNHLVMDTKQYCLSVLKPATLEEKQTLIRAEINHGYFHELIK